MHMAAKPMQATSGIPRPMIRPIHTPGIASWLPVGFAVSLMAGVTAVWRLAEVVVGEAVDVERKEVEGVMRIELRVDGDGVGAVSGQLGRAHGSSEQQPRKLLLLQT